MHCILKNKIKVVQGLNFCVVGVKNANVDSFYLY